MSLTDLSAWSTVVLFVLFIGIVAWAYSSKRKVRFDEAAQLPFTEEELPGDGRQPGEKSK